MSGVPYLGCKISLVSKSERRYEGVLYTIDTKESTVALAKVRSFGTEGRPTDRPVPPHDEIYEYIIFRTSDIKDLHVSEAAKPQPTLNASGLPNDPAIVQVFHSAPLQTCPVSYAQSPYGHVCGLPSFSHYPSQVAFPHVPSIFPGNHGRSSGTSSQSSFRKSPTIDAGVQVPAENFHEKGSQSSLPDLSRNSIQDVRQTSSVPHFQRRATVPTIRQMQRGRGMMRRPRGGGYGRGRGSSMSVRILEPLRFECEYDFEQANAEFQELETRLAKAKLDDSGTETIGGEMEEDLTSYNREKSFFDNISCEASRVEKGIPRFDWRIERKLNVETFGVPGSEAWLRRRRGRGGFRRGGRGRGRANATAVVSEPTRTTEPPKTVTFCQDTLVTVESKVEEVEDCALEVAEPPSSVPVEDIPVIDIVVEKEEQPKVWEEGAAVQDAEPWN